MGTAKRKNNFIEDNLLIISKQTMDLLLSQKNPADLIALYNFYYYTAKWQKTNQPKASIDYVAKGLHWGKDKVIRTKRILEDLGLISEVKNIDPSTGRVKGWFIRLNYLWKQENHIPRVRNVEKPDSSIPEGGNQEPSALSANNLNALKTFSYENGDKPQKVKTIGALLKEKFQALTSKPPSNKLKEKFQAYGVECANIAGLYNGGRGRIIKAFKQYDWGYRQVQKTKLVIRQSAYKSFIDEDIKVRYLIKSLKGEVKNE